MEGAHARRSLTMVTASAFALLIACSSGSGNGIDTLGPPPEASPTGNVPPAVTSPPPVTGATSGGPLPTTSPGITGSVNAGSASLAVSGALQTSQPAIPLASPAIYSPPPGAFTLAWTSAAAGFALGGTSFVGTRPTSAALRLTFFVHSASGDASFVSDDGTCNVSVTTADAAAFAGTYSCHGVADANGTLVVDALGSFGATG